MDEIKEGLVCKFTTKIAANDFIGQVKKAIYQCDVIVTFDVLKLLGRPIKGDHTIGFHYGYAKKDIKSIKPVKIDGDWTVTLPAPKKMIQDEQTGHWTTEDLPKEGDG